MRWVVGVGPAKHTSGQACCKIPPPKKIRHIFEKDHSINSSPIDCACRDVDVPAVRYSGSNHCGSTGIALKRAQQFAMTPLTHRTTSISLNEIYKRTKSPIFDIALYVVLYVSSEKQVNREAP
jgi:hypothetical protein